MHDRNRFNNQSNIQIFLIPLNSIIAQFDVNTAFGIVFACFFRSTRPIDIRRDSLRNLEFLDIYLEFHARWQA